MSERRKGERELSRENKGSRRGMRERESAQRERERERDWQGKASQHEIRFIVHFSFLCTTGINTMHIR